MRDNEPGAWSNTHRHVLPSELRRRRRDIEIVVLVEIVDEPLTLLLLQRTVTQWSRGGRWIHARMRECRALPTGSDLLRILGAHVTPRVRSQPSDSSSNFWYSPESSTTQA